MVDRSLDILKSIKRKLKIFLDSSLEPIQAIIRVDGINYTHANRRIFSPIAATPKPYNFYRQNGYRTCIIQNGLKNNLKLRKRKESLKG